MENIQPASIQRKKTPAFHFIDITVLLILCLLFSILLSACNSAINLLGSGEWQAASLTKQHIHALAIDSKNSQELYAGDADGSIYSSIDGGLHWTKRSQVSSTAPSIQVLAMAPTSKSLFALTNVGLFVSTDQAQTWKSVTSTNAGLPDDSYTAMTFNGQKSIFVGTSKHGVYMSIASDGLHWQSITGNLPTSAVINELAFDSTQNQLWAATSQGVYRTASNGQSWTRFDSGLPSNEVTSVQLAVIYGGTPGLVYAGTPQGIYRSMDNGAHWSPSGQVLSGVLIYHILIDFRSANAQTVYAATRFGVFRSDDSGQNWAGVAANFPKNVPIFALVIGGTGASQLYVVANNIYLYPGTDTGLNPTRIVTLLLVVLLFVLLIVIAQRGLRRRLPTQKSKATEKVSMKPNS